MSPLGPTVGCRRTAVLAAHWEAVQQLMLLLPRYWTDDLAWLARVSPPSFLMLHPQLLERMAAAAQDMVSAGGVWSCCFIEGGLGVRGCYVCDLSASNRNRLVPC